MNELDDIDMSVDSATNSYKDNVKYICFIMII